jgi:hypothetical protein
VRVVTLRVPALDGRFLPPDMFFLDSDSDEWPSYEGAFLRESIM